MKLHNILSKLRQTAPLHLREGMGVGLCLLLFTACETVDEADRWTEPQPIEMKKNVLVEDFTGQNCVNCPAAAALLHDLTGSSMGEHIVAVSIHGGALAMGIDKSPLGLATEIGEKYNTFFGVQAWPSGMIDRTDGNGNAGKTCDFTSWTAAIVNQLSKELITELDINTTYDAATRELHVTVGARPADGPHGELNSGMTLTVWLTESNITGFQKFSDHNDTQYVHNHVLRDCLSHPYGDYIVENATFGENTLDLNYTYTIPATYGRNKWAVNPEQMSVVAFVTDYRGEVLQVVDAPVVK